MAAAHRTHECSFLCGVCSKTKKDDDYSSWTSIALHGVARVKKAQSDRQRLLWALLVAFGTLVSVVQTKITFSAYLENVSATRVTVQEKPRIRFPTMYVCPKSPDAQNQTRVREDMMKHLGPYWSRLDEDGIRHMAAYAIAGAGIGDMEKILQKFTAANRMRLNRLFRKWLGKRSYESFYKTMFETNGYRCDEMFDRCLYAGQKVNCCDIFEQSYEMLRGRCFRLKKLYQPYPERHGQLTIVLKQLPSWFVEKDGKQREALVYLADPGTEAATFPRYHFNPSSFNQIIITKRHIKMLESNIHCDKTLCKRCGSECYIKR
ncbi:Protein DEL-7 [Aphelenchoides avenae]|nr:Protein DEL-7 [Aphelenchus avenae]